MDHIKRRRFTLCLLVSKFKASADAVGVDGIELSGWRSATPSCTAFPTANVSFGSLWKAFHSDPDQNLVPSASLRHSGRTKRDPDHRHRASPSAPPWFGMSTGPLSLALLCKPPYGGDQLFSLKANMSTLLVSSKGQIVLPAEMRRRLGMGAGARIEVCLLYTSDAADE